MTAPPKPDHLQVAVRAEPAPPSGRRRNAAFLQQDGATVIVIGDVVGHDTAAAAAMGQVGACWASRAQRRRPRRGARAWTGDGDPDARHDRHGHRGPPRHEPDGAGPDDPAVLVERRPPAPDGDRRPSLRQHAGPRRAGPAAGLDPGTPRPETEVTLRPGTTLLLYTDGLVERRGQPLEEALTGCTTARRAGRATSASRSCATRCCAPC